MLITNYARTSFGGGGGGFAPPPWIWEIMTFCVFAHNFFLHTYFAPPPSPRKSVKMLPPPGRTEITSLQLWLGYNSPMRLTSCVGGGNERYRLDYRQSRQDMVTYYRLPSGMKSKSIKSISNYLSVIGTAKAQCTPLLRTKLSYTLGYWRKN